MSYAQLSGLLEEAYGTAPAEAELAWWFDENPVGTKILSVAGEKGAAGMSLARVAADGRECVAAFIVHAVTTPSARGQGVFSTLQRANEEQAAAAGAVLALGFTTREATRVLSGRLGWRLISRPRIWARPRLSRRGGGARIEGFEERHEELGLGGPAHLLKDRRWLDWRYRDSPRPYRLFETEGGWATIGIGRHRGVRAGSICELRGGLDALRGAARTCPAPLVLALPNPHEQRLYAAAGFLPTPWLLHFVGKSLDPALPLPSEWRLSLGDTDFF
jgi:GNAT superfamily N-acetyltransferase